MEKLDYLNPKHYYKVGDIVKYKNEKAKVLKLEWYCGIPDCYTIRLESMGDDIFVCNDEIESDIEL